MNGISQTHDYAGNGPITKRRRRSPVAWIGLMATISLLAAACAGATGSTQEASDGASPNDGTIGSGRVGSANPATSDDADVAPDFEITVFGNDNHPRGEAVALSQFLGQPVVINFWFPSCPPCRAEMPDLQKSFSDHRADGVQFIGVELLGLDTAEDGQEFIDEVGVTYAVGPDEKGRIVRDYEVISFPTTVFLDRDHRIVTKWGGILTAGLLEELVQEIIPGAVDDQA